MQSHTSPISEPEDENSGSRSVLDFLYNDSRRIGSFLSQFEGDGHLQQLSRNKSGSRGKAEKAGGDFKGNAGFASGTLQGGTETTVKMDEGYTRIFDPYWSNARAFLDHVTDLGLLNEDVKSARIGQIVRAQGLLSILDLSIMKEAWAKKTIQKKIHAGNGERLGNLTAAQKRAVAEAKGNTDLMLEMMQVLPHSTHATLLSVGDNPFLLWGTLRDEYLVSPASDLTLAHGSRIPGEWSIVGILSGGPDFASDEEDSVDAEPGVLESLVGTMTKELAGVVKVVLGKPSAAYAITPLLIFRTVD